MPTINTSNGKIHYKTHSLYAGIKYIDKDIANENLCLFKEILSRNDLHFLLLYGTLLGAVREHDFISHDEDIDVAFLQEDKQAFFDILPQLLESGFEIARYDRRDLLSVIRKGEYIDCYFFEYMEEGVRSCEGNFVLEKHLKNRQIIEFKGEKYEAPTDYVGFLEWEYGPSWQTPIEWHDFNMPLWKRICFNIKEHIKDILPQFLYSFFANRSMKKTEMKYRTKLNHYLDDGGKLY